MYCLSKKTVRILKQGLLILSKNKQKVKKKPGSNESECDISCF